jgi:hypothetical protein
MTLHGSRFVSYFIPFPSYFVAFPKEKKPLRRLLCRFLVSIDDAALSVQFSVSLSVAWSLSPDRYFVAFTSEMKSLCRFLSIYDAALSQA